MLSNINTPAVPAILVAVGLGIASRTGVGRER